MNHTSNNNILNRGLHLSIETKDLFSVDESYYLCHCISSDFALGAGIAKEFNNRGVRKTLETIYTPFWDYKGYCLYTKIDNFKGVFNLVTKRNYYDKPTYDTLRESLESMRIMISDGMKIAMPLIGCGLDKLSWEKVEQIIIDTFKNKDVEILVCKL